MWLLLHKKIPDFKLCKWATTPVPLEPLPLFKHSEVCLSIIVPAYNEELRLPSMFSNICSVLKQTNEKFLLDSEIIVVDDGSLDKTVEIAMEYPDFEIQSRLRVLKMPVNSGKGAAVRAGMLASRGEYLLFADADGATEFSDILHLKSKLHDIAIGSRAVVSQNVKRSFFRKMLMVGFHVLVSILGTRGIKDTQCGFKLFTRNAAQKVFPCMHVPGWIFDIEILLLAQWNNLKIQEVPVSWSEIEGSKVNVVMDSIKMLLDLFKIRLCYTLGLWKTKSKFE